MQRISSDSACGCAIPPLPPPHPHGEPPGHLGYIPLHSATLGLALERAARYLQLWTEATH
jgi:hypothetical protein